VIREGKIVPVRVILLEPEKSGNIGAVARSMRNFDLDDLWIVRPKAPINGEARAFAVRGLPILESAKIVSSLDKALKGVDVVVGTSSVAARSSSNISRIAISPKQLAERISKSKGFAGIVFGRESSGLNNQEVERCDFMVTIPASHEYNVLNIAVAASIVFYELFHRKATRHAEGASQASKKRLLLQFDHLAAVSDLQSHKRRLAKRAFRNMISRSFISSREASLLVGVFRKASAKLGKLK
jgi:TrmH family RNA methyltransferase